MKRPPLPPDTDPAVARRLDALATLIDAEYSGSTAEFERRTGVKMAQVSQWFSGYRQLRENAVKKLEAATGKQPGFFDQPMTLDGPSATLTVTRASLSPLALVAAKMIDQIEDDVLKTQIVLSLQQQVEDWHLRQRSIAPSVHDQQTQKA